MEVGLGGQMGIAGGEALHGGRIRAHSLFGDSLLGLLRMRLQGLKRFRYFVTQRQ